MTQDARVPPLAKLLAGWLLIAILLQPQSVRASVPLHPEAYRQQQQQEQSSSSSSGAGPLLRTRNMRERQADSYTPRFLNAQVCKNAQNNTWCEQMDRSLQEHSERTQHLIIQSSGTLRSLVILAQFEDHVDRPLPTSDEIDQMLNAKDNSNNSNVSVRSYLDRNSHGNLEVQFDVIPWMAIPFAEEECTFGNAGLDRDFAQCLWPILDSLDKLHHTDDHPFDWSHYDENQDGFLDSLLVLHSGFGAEWGDLDASDKTSEGRIWSHAMGAPSLGDDDHIVWRSSSMMPVLTTTTTTTERSSSQQPRSTVQLGSYAVSSALWGHMGQKVAPIGIIVHELLHTLGLPDLFDLSLESQRGGAGRYSILSDVWGPQDDPSFPVDLDAWSKVKLGWVHPIPIHTSGRYQMRPSTQYSDIYMISDPYPEGEYLLLENRPGGALVWHIDDAVTYNVQGGGTHQPDWPQNGKHYQVAVVQADGRFDLEDDSNMGNARDLFRTGDRLGPGDGRGVYPNTDTYQDGIVTRTDIDIAGFNVTDDHISFTVIWFKELIDGVPAHLIGRPPPAAIPIDACLVTVNAEDCPRLMKGVDIDDSSSQGCDCWNFCGNGVAQQCCKFGEPCNIYCHSGELTAGCTSAALSGIKDETPPIVMKPFTPGERNDDEYDEASPSTEGDDAIAGGGVWVDESTGSHFVGDGRLPVLENILEEIKGDVPEMQRPEEGTQSQSGARTPAAVGLSRLLVLLPVLAHQRGNILGY